MLPTGEIIEEVARLVREHHLENFVVDPVVRSTSGFDLIDDAALEILIEKLFPLAAVVTPNLPEAERIAQMRIENADDVEKAARVMQSFGARNVLIKGGHLFKGESEFKSKSENQSKTARDFLFIGEDLRIFETAFIETDATHGTGCTLAAAIAANLALGKTLVEAVETAKRFVTEAIRTAPNIGRGHSPINQLIEV
jgi:hydroxymethylpyrimidine kinase/phosphomethylpyrimidine kinase